MIFIEIVFTLKNCSEKNKLYKYFVWKCPKCKSKLYYNQSNRGGKMRVCYKCGNKEYF